MAPPIIFVSPQNNLAKNSGKGLKAAKPANGSPKTTDLFWQSQFYPPKGFLPFSVLGEDASDESPFPLHGHGWTVGTGA